MSGRGAILAGVAAMFLPELRSEPDEIGWRQRTRYVPPPHDDKAAMDAAAAKRARKAAKRSPTPTQREDDRP